jgi:SAM-dependent methyltransferase
LKPCKICQSNTISYTHPKFNFIFHECLTCQFIFKDEINYISKENELKIYDQHHNTLDNKGYVNYLTNFVESAVIPFVEKGKALDYGSGPNPVLAHLLKENFGFDVSIYDFYYAKNDHYLNQTYDVITVTEVIEHIHNPLATFLHLKTLLKNGGYMCIMTLFHPNDQTKLFNWFYMRDLSHVSFFSPKTMISIAQLTGLKLVECNDHRITVFMKVGD